MKSTLPADHLPCGCVGEETLSVFVSSCFENWGKYGEFKKVGFEDCLLHESEPMRSQVVVCPVGHSVMVTFRGYNRFHGVFGDIDTMAVPFEIVNSGARVNAIFLNAYMDLRQKTMEFIDGLEDVRSIYVVGHSMGAALATLAAVDLATKYGLSTNCYTFGSPKVGDAWFGKIYRDHVEHTTRYVSPTDPIPFYPWEKEYVHVCRSKILGNPLDRIILYAGIVRHWLRSLVGMSSWKNICNEIGSFTGIEGHELYNYAFMVRETDEKDLI